MNDETFLIVYKWMNKIEIKTIVECKKTKEKKEVVRKLTHLEKEVYAVVYGFSKDKQGNFIGSCQYIADLVGSNRVTVTNILKTLTENNLLKKQIHFENKNKFCIYIAIKPVMSDYTPCNEQLHPPVMSDYTPCNEQLHNSINNNINNKIDDSKFVKKNVKFSEEEKKEIIEAYYNSYNSLFEKNILTKEKPYFQYNICIARLNQLAKDLSKDDLITVFKNAVNDKWTVEQGFSFIGILSNNQINKHLNNNKQATEKKSSWKEREDALLGDWG